MPTTTSARATKATKTASKATKAKQPATKAKASNGTPKPAKATKAKAVVPAVVPAAQQPNLTGKQYAILAAVCNGAQTYGNVRVALKNPRAKGLTRAMAATSGVGTQYPNSLQARGLVTKGIAGRYIVYAATPADKAAAKAYAKAQQVQTKATS